MKQLPEFITFTGVDDRTSTAGMRELSRLYPIEWGVLFSATRQGIADEPRYPSWPCIQTLVFWRRDLALSAHLCGTHARDASDHGLVHGIDAMLGRYFRRAQVNYAVPDIHGVAAWSKRVGVKAIVQHRYRDGFTSPDTSVQLLFDASGGRGIKPEAWPVLPTDGLLYGYAGGLDPDNVRAAVDAIGTSPGRYWLDMETGVRTDDRFDVDKCRAVCEAVYGKSLFEG